MPPVAGDAAAVRGGFSIRGYAAAKRTVDMATSWPFAGGGGGRDFEAEKLPPMLVRRFRWWADELSAVALSAKKSLERNPCRHRAPKKRSVLELFAAVPPISASDCGEGEGGSAVKRRKKPQPKRTKKGKAVAFGAAVKASRKDNPEKTNLSAAFSIEPSQEPKNEKVSTLKEKKVIGAKKRKGKVRKKPNKHNRGFRKNYDLVTNRPLNRILRKWTHHNAVAKGRSKPLNSDLAELCHEAVKHVACSGFDGLKLSEQSSCIQQTQLQSLCGLFSNVLASSSAAKNLNDGEKIASVSEESQVCVTGKSIVLSSMDMQNVVAEQSNESVATGREDPVGNIDLNVSLYDTGDLYDTCTNQPELSIPPDLRTKIFESGTKYDGKNGMNDFDKMDSSNVVMKTSPRQTSLQYHGAKNLSDTSVHPQMFQYSQKSCQLNFLPGSLNFTDGTFCSFGSQEMRDFVVADTLSSCQCNRDAGHGIIGLPLNSKGEFINFQPLSPTENRIHRGNCMGTNVHNQFNVMNNIAVNSTYTGFQVTNRADQFRQFCCYHPGQGPPSLAGSGFRNACIANTICSDVRNKMMLLSKKNIVQESQPACGQTMCLMGNELMLSANICKAECSNRKKSVKHGTDTRRHTSYDLFESCLRREQQDRLACQRHYTTTNEMSFEKAWCINHSEKIYHGRDHEQYVLPDFGNQKVTGLSFCNSDNIVGRPIHEIGRCRPSGASRAENAYRLGIHNEKHFMPSERFMYISEQRDWAANKSMPACVLPISSNRLPDRKLPEVILRTTDDSAATTVPQAGNQIVKNCNGLPKLGLQEVQSACGGNASRSYAGYPTSALRPLPALALNSCTTEAPVSGGLGKNIRGENDARGLVGEVRRELRHEKGNIGILEQHTIVGLEKQPISGRLTGISSNRQGNGNAQHNGRCGEGPPIIDLTEESQEAELTGVHADFKSSAGDGRIPRLLKLSAGARHILEPNQKNEQVNAWPVYSYKPLVTRTSSKAIAAGQNTRANAYMWHC